MNELIVVIFDDELKAEDALRHAGRLRKTKTLVIDDACVVVRRTDGKVTIHETRDMQAGQGAMLGGFLGLLTGAFFAFPVVGLAGGAGLGAVIARLRDYGISNDLQKDVAARLQPGTSAAIFLVDQSTVEAALRDAEGLGGTVLHGGVSPDAEKALRDALAKGSDAAVEHLATAAPR